MAVQAFFQGTLVNVSTAATTIKAAPTAHKAILPLSKPNPRSTLATHVTRTAKLFWREEMLAVSLAGPLLLGDLVAVGRSAEGNKRTVQNVVRYIQPTCTNSSNFGSWKAFDGDKMQDKHRDEPFLSGETTPYLQDDSNLLYCACQHYQGCLYPSQERSWKRTFHEKHVTPVSFLESVYQQL